MAAAATTDVSTRSSLPPPSPKSPPDYPDLYGKRREVARVQMLEREIGFLEEELKSARNFQPASRCCKEVSDFVLAKPDPLIPTKQKYSRSCHFWRWLCGMPCFNLSWICCCCCCPRCSLRCKLPKCCHCKSCDCCSGSSCLGCSCLPLKFSCCSSRCLKSNCCRKDARSNCTKCCTCQSSCVDCSCCCKCSCSCLRCPKVNLCPNCIKSCCNCKLCCFCC